MSAVTGHAPPPREGKARAWEWEGGGRRALLEAPCSPASLAEPGLVLAKRPWYAGGICPGNQEPWGQVLFPRECWPLPKRPPCSRPPGHTVQLRVPSWAPAASGMGSLHSSWPRPGHRSPEPAPSVGRPGGGELPCPGESSGFSVSQIPRGAREWRTLPHKAVLQSSGLARSQGSLALPLGGYVHVGDSPGVCEPQSPHLKEGLVTFHPTGELKDCSQCWTFKCYGSRLGPGSWDQLHVPQLSPLPAVGMWLDFLISLCLCFLTCKVGILISED